MRRRIIGLAVLAAILATSLFGVPLAIGAANYYLSDESRELEYLADTAAIAISPDLVQGQVTDLPTVEPETLLAVYDPTGALVLGRGPDVADGFVTAAMFGATSRGSSGGDLVVAVPVLDDNQVIAVVRAATARSQVYARTATTWLVMFGLAGLAVALTWVVARRQAGRLASPLESLAKAADALGEGDFSVRTEASGIAEIDTAGRSLNSTAHRLGAVLTRERAFSADASHQLRTPLTGIRLHLETALETSGDRSSGQAIGAALTEVDRLERTISDLLSLARRSSSGQSLDVTRLVNEIRADWHARLAAAGRPLRLVQEPELPATTARTAAVRQVLTVLLDNAVKHGRGPVTVTARDAGGFLALDVADEGPGPGPGSPPVSDQPAAPELPASPEQPASPEPPTSPEHHGLGLELARSLAEAEGGRLVSSVDSAAFTLLLPAAT